MRGSSRWSWEGSRAHVELLRAREPSHDHRLEPRILYESDGDLQCLLVVGGERDRHLVAGAMGLATHRPVADLVECAHQASPGKELGRSDTGALLARRHRHV